MNSEISLAGIWIEYRVNCWKFKVGTKQNTLITSVREGVKLFTVQIEEFLGVYCVFQYAWVLY